VTDCFDRLSWEERWARVKGKRRSPSAHLVQTASDLTPGLALDAGAGNGTETLWLAEQGWQVDALDFAATALQDGAEAAAQQRLADRIAWLQADLSVWSPAPAHYDLVACLYVHVVGSVQDLVRRLAGGVVPGGTLLLVGHHPAPGQVQVSVNDAVAVLDGWKLVVAEDRPHMSGSGVDALVRAVRPA
jgi:2-polyprenyl-3-methyl-5-hydroxy-6-metoxy-1,4-benzoquinol methylase